MITEYIRYAIPHEQGSAFEAAYAAAAGSLTSSPYCVDFELSRCVEEPGSYILQIHWTSDTDHPDKFRAGPEFSTFFGHVRPYVDHIVEMRHYQPGSVRGIGRGHDPEVPTLYDWAGGRERLEQLFEHFYELVADDPLIGPLFAGMDSDHPRHVAAWIGEVFGGPRRYTEERGGYSAMLGRHLGLSITPQQRRRWVTLLQDAADDIGLPDDPEFRAAFVGYLEWGTRIAMSNSRPGAAPPLTAAVPKWDWGIAPPWLG